MGSKRSPLGVDFDYVGRFHELVVVGRYRAGLGVYCLEGFEEGGGDCFLGEV